MKKEKNLKEKFKNAKSILEAENIDGFEFIYFKSTRRTHDNGYYMFEIYGEKNNTFYNLSQCSDVIDFEKVKFNLNWFASIDIPEPSIFRIFPRRGETIFAPFKSCSSFLLNFLED